MTLTTDHSTRRYVTPSSAPLVKTDKRRQHSGSNTSAVNQQSKVLHSAPTPIPQSSQNSQIRSQQLRCNISSSPPVIAISPNNSNGTSSSFIDCLIRRFKDCFSQDFCSVPVFVVGNVSPGSDGTHLILPPCISLNGQSISRFASPKNLRLMNQIRESCRNVEELDLGTNKLNDLVEIYKILQVTPNLRILNLSENDLSKAMPMALATTNSSSVSRSYLSPLNSNNLPGRHNSSLFHGSTHHATFSTLRGTGTRQSQTKVNEISQVTSTTATILGSRSNPSSSRASAGGSATGLKERRAARTSAAISRSVSALSAKDTRAAVSRFSTNQRKKGTSSIKGSNRGMTSNTTTTAHTTINNNYNHVSQVGHATTSSQKLKSNMACEDIVMTGTSVLSLQAASPPQTSSPISGSAIGTHYTGNSSSNNNINANVSHNSTNNTGNIYFRRIFETIKVLAMNNTRCPWRVVCSILLRMPNLEELHLSLNNYEKIELDSDNFKHHQLKRLYLCNNPKLTNWNELDKILAAFPSLEALSIADCNISQIPDNLDRAREWRKLCGLNIAGWPIKEWPVIERLNQLPSLVDLKCQNLELLNEIEEPENRRHHLIARLPKLIRLNGSEIEEREHAEKAFVRFFITNQHLEKPDRFYELFQVHGEVRPVADVDLSPPNKANVRIVYHLNKDNDDILMSEDFLTKILDQTSVHNNHGPSNDEPTSDEGDDEDRQLCNPMDLWNKPQVIMKNEDQEVVAMTVDLRKSVRNFKLELSSIFNFSDPSKMILYYIDHEMVGLVGPELMKHNQKKLWNYNVQNGDQFIVEEA